MIPMTWSPGASDFGGYLVRYPERCPPFLPMVLVDVRSKPQDWEDQVWADAESLRVCRRFGEEGSFLKSHTVLSGVVQHLEC